MGLASLISALLGLVALVLPGVGKYVAIGLGMFAIASGVVAWRRRASRRLAGAGGVAVGLVALSLGAAQVALTVVALDKLAGLFHR